MLYWVATRAEAEATRWLSVCGKIKKLPRDEGIDLMLIVRADHGGWAWATAHIPYRATLERGEKPIKFALDHMVEELEKVSPR